MARYLVIRGEEAKLKVELAEGPTAEEIWDRLPLEARETAEVGYWPPGNALCLFFGPTPASVNDKPRPASPVTVVGKIVEGLDGAKLVGSAETLRVEGVEE